MVLNKYKKMRVIILPIKFKLSQRLQRKMQMLQKYCYCCQSYKVSAYQLINNANDEVIIILTHWFAKCGVAKWKQGKRNYHEFATIPAL